MLALIKASCYLVAKEGVCLCMYCLVVLVIAKVIYVFICAVLCHALGILVIGVWFERILELG